MAPVEDASVETAKAESQLIRAIIICVVFMIAEAIGGSVAGSLAIMTDAAHLLSDVAGFSVSLVCLWLARRKSTTLLSFGFKRAEVLGALLSVSLIWIVTGFLLVEAIARMLQILSEDPAYEPVNGYLMFIIAVVGLLCNLIILRILGHSHSPGGTGRSSHGHSPAEGEENDNRDLEPGHTPTPPFLNEKREMNGLSIRYSLVSDYSAITPPSMDNNARQEEERNLNIETAYIHAIGDFLQSVGVIVAGALIWMYPAKTNPRMQLCDPIATFLFSLLVLYSTMHVLKTLVNVLMEGVPAGLDAARIKSDIERLPGVSVCHDLHIWSLSLGLPFLSVHVVLEETARSEVVLKRVQELLISKYQISHSTVQVEPQTIYSDDTLKKYAECHEYVGNDL